MKVVSRQAAAGGDTEAVSQLPLRVCRKVYVRDLTVPSPPRGLREWHNYLLGCLQRWSIPALRLTLGIVFLWFGILKLLDASPVTQILKHTYSFLPLWPFAVTLGVWEAMVGVGLMLKRAMRCTLGLLWLHLSGTFVALLLAPAYFFHHNNPLWLTVEGEFVIKNMVLVAAGLVIAGHEVTPLGEREKAAALPLDEDVRKQRVFVSRKELG